MALYTLHLNTADKFSSLGVSFCTCSVHLGSKGAAPENEQMILQREWDMKASALRQCRWVDL